MNQTEPLGALALHELVVFPQTSVPLNIGQPGSVQLVNQAFANGERLALFLGREDEPEASGGPTLAKHIGTLAEIYRLLRRPDGTIRLLVNGLERISIGRLDGTDQARRAVVRRLREETVDTNEAVALGRSLIESFATLAELTPSIPWALVAPGLDVKRPLHLAYTVASYVQPEARDAQMLLELNPVEAKLRWVNNFVNREIEILLVGQRIKSKAADQLDRAQREYYLREQLRAIQSELGEADERQAEVASYRRRFERALLPEEASRAVEIELQRLLRLPPNSGEYSVVRDYLEWMADVPWSESTDENLDLERARRVLDEDHFGLKEVKERILELLAVRWLRRERGADNGVTGPSGGQERQAEPGTILCLVGPPGVGKTSVGRSVARALNREFARIALGGVRDEAEIRGHRRTYVGAMPGRIVQTLRRLGSNNPVLMLDEVDKMSAGFQGDPAAALLEVLDGEQNREFVDHFLGVPVDLSRAIFIATANYLDPVPPALADRLEVLHLPGYSESEKVEIARRFLVPRQIRANGLLAEELTFGEGTLNAIVANYTHESGVRALERAIAQICRKAAVSSAAAMSSGPAGRSPTVLQSQELRQYLGPRLRPPGPELPRWQTGVATGLAWTEQGGEVILVEARSVDGRGGLSITGHVGAVMRESAETALTYLRSRASALALAPEFFRSRDLHVHVPAGAVPKDGPSAGLAIAVALASILTGRRVDNKVGMTGEITLRGDLMPVGGLRAKVLAAQRAQLAKIVVPAQNKEYIEDISTGLDRPVEFLLVDTVAEAIELALEQVVDEGAPVAN